MNDHSKKHPLNSRQNAELTGVETASEIGGAGKQLWLNCFRFLRRLFIVTIGVYLLMIGCLMLFENRLVYPGSKYPIGNWESEEQGFTEVEFAAADDTKLFGWYLPWRGLRSEETGSEASVSVRPRTILHCHGNGENIAQVGAYTVKQFSKVLQANVFSFDYRSYGKSEGSPTENGVKQDADAALAWVCQQDGVQPKDIIIVGHSIGGGLACYLAKKHDCKALILQRTFSSLPDAAARKFWMFPVHWVMRNQLNSAEAIKSCDVPLFQSHGDADTLVPINLGKKLFKNSPSTNKKLFSVPGMTHWGRLPDRYWVELEAFISQVDSSIPAAE